MAGSLMSKSPTCLACLRRLAQPFGSSNGSASAVSLVQVRAKSNRLRPKDQGVVVRLLADIPKFGRKDSVFLIERGRMRNEWFPHKKAEYMTAARFQELGMTRGDIGDRDTTFGVVTATELEDIPEPAAPTATVLTTTPEKTHTLLTTLIPETLNFFRKPIPAPAPPREARAKISPLVASANESNANPAPDTNATLAIFGSVSPVDILSTIKARLVEDTEGRRLVLEPENIRILGLGEGADRIKALGRWEIEISVGGVRLEPVRKVVEVLPLAATDE